ncbi:MAG: ABC transporter permease [Clostridiales bacterium]|jgi:spermidine/putrescine transport system permease protein|nr:ABC transporter permease [Clostridiales bacterium]
MKVLKRAYLAVILIFLYAPIVVLIVFSFNEAKSRGVWGGFSLKWYGELFKDRQIIQALYNTLLIAAISAVTATAIGTAAALGINAMRRTPRKVILNLSNIPVMNPDIVTGVSLMLLFLFIVGLIGKGNLGFGTLLMSHITFNIPYVTLSVLPKVRQLDPAIYEAAQDLGAKPFTSFWRVVFPQLLPGIVTGMIFAFTLSLDDFVISFFTTGPGVSNLSIIIYSSAAKRGINPEINALSTFMFVVVLLLLFLINRRDARELKKNKKKEIRT